MKSATASPAILLLVAVLSGASAQIPEDSLKSRAERTNYEETSRYEDVVRFFNELHQRTSLMRLEHFGVSQEGRTLPLAILSDPPVAQPREARDSGKPVL